ncbi:MAG: hypothetical protein WDZ63_12605 [Burkholderiales bacterium]
MPDFLTEKQLCRGIHRSTRQLATAIGEYFEIINNPGLFVRMKTADEIRAIIRRCWMRTSD